MTQDGRQAGHTGLDPQHLGLSLDTVSPTASTPHLGKGDEEELVVCILEPVQRVLWAVLPHPLLIGLGVQTAGSSCATRPGHCSISILRGLALPWDAESRGSSPFFTSPSLVTTTTGCPPATLLELCSRRVTLGHSHPSRKPSPLSW